MTPTDACDPCPDCNCGRLKRTSATPTDAQIEAAYIQGFEDCTNARTDRYAALTAAAEVGDYDLKCTNGHDRCYMGTSDDCPYCERVPVQKLGSD
jgi:DNA-binding helix-hairpin-helix protein with protein kinase domain